MRSHVLDALDCCKYRLKYGTFSLRVDTVQALEEDTHCVVLSPSTSPSALVVNATERFVIRVDFQMLTI